MTSIAIRALVRALADDPIYADIYHDAVDVAPEEAAQRWPACALCQKPVLAGPRVVGVPRPYRPGFIIHGACHDFVRGGA